MKIFKPAFILFFIFGCCSDTISANNFPLWGNLQKGEFSTGFKTTWELDYSRAYNTIFSDKTAYTATRAPRPILINIWYPAISSSSKTMTQGEYLSFISTVPQLAKFSKELAVYERSVIAQEVVRKKEKEFDVDEKRLFEQLLASPTAAVKNAKAQNGKFPLIVYHSGNGSSIEDNSVLCEYLASNGYVIISSAFQDASGENFNVDAEENSRADVRYLIDYARRLPNVNWNKIGIMGHSAGAHTMNRFQALGDSAADVLVSLDTTQDYHPLSNNLWESMTRDVLAKGNIPNMRVPSLVVAGRTAIFEMFDKLKESDRYYFTTRNMGHNDYISQGIFRKRLKEKLDLIKSKKTEEIKQDQDELNLAQSGNEAVCLYILNFFDAYLKGNQKSKDYLLNKYKNNTSASREPNAEFVSKGMTKPPVYDSNSSVPPTPRQLRYIIAEQGIDKTVSILKRFSSEATTAPIYDKGFVYILLNEMLDEKKDDAMALLRVYEQGSPSFRKDISNTFMGWGDIYILLGGNDKAISSFQKALIIDPENTKAAAKIKELQEKTDKAKK